MDPTPNTRNAAFWRRFRLGVATFLVLVLGICFVGWLLVHGSLPLLAGSERLPGLHAVVTVERDAHGVPTIKASNREDLMCALGYLHAQDRFFQMDLLRRQGAGELSELFGAARQHRFRRQAAEVIRSTSTNTPQA